METHNSLIKNHRGFNNSESEPIEKPLNYNEQHLRMFFLSRPAISITKIEADCEVPKGTLRHFIKNRRNIPLKYLQAIENEPLDYGYTTLDNE